MGAAYGPYLVSYGQAAILGVTMLAAAAALLWNGDGTPEKDDEGAESHAAADRRRRVSMFSGSLSSGSLMHIGPDLGALSGGEEAGGQELGLPGSAAGGRSSDASASESQVVPQRRKLSASTV